MANDPLWANTTLLLHSDSSPDANIGSIVLGNTYKNQLTAEIGTLDVGSLSTYAINAGRKSYAYVAQGATANTTVYNTGTTAVFDADFTVETWIYSYSMPGVSQYFAVLSSCVGTASGNYGGFGFTFNANGSGVQQISCNVRSTSPNTITYSVPTSQWFHLAVSVVSGTVRVYINGSLVQTFTAGATAYPTVNGIRQSFHSGAATYGFYGYISDLRVYKGLGKYTASTISVPPYPAPLLVPSLDASSTSVNTYATGSAVTPYTATSKFGGGCLRFDGASQLKTVASANSNFGTADFTIEGWFYILGDSVLFMGKRDATLIGISDGAGARSLLVSLTGTTTGSGGFKIYDATSGKDYVFSTTVTSGVWHHLALCRAAGTVYAFLDGILAGVKALATSLGSASYPVVLGGEASTHSAAPPYALGATATWTNIVWNGTIFCAIATGTNQVATSTDGKNWTSLPNMPVSSGWVKLAWNGTYFCAISNTTGTTAATSTNGVTWVASTLPATATWSNITWAPNLGIFLAISTTLSGIAATSSTGLNGTWTQRALPVLVSPGGWNSLGYSPDNGGFVIRSNNCSVTNICANSADGITWVSMAGHGFTVMPTDRIVVFLGAYYEFSYGAGTMYNIRTSASSGVGVTGNLPSSLVVTDAAVVGGYLVISTTSGLYFSATGATGSWTSLPTGVTPTWLATNGSLLAMLTSSTTMLSLLDANALTQKSNYYYNGLMDEVRITNGAARYKPYDSWISENLPTALDVSGSEAYWADTAIALNMEASPFTDAKGNTITTSGSVVRSSAQAKYGSYSAYFNGTAAYIEALPYNACNFGSNFTIECWFYAGVQAGNAWNVGPLFDQCSNAGNGEQFSGVTTSNTVMFFQNNAFRAIPDVYLTSDVITLNQWHHYALSCSGGVLKLFVDGKTNAGSIATGFTWAQKTQPFRIGASILAAGNYYFYFNGYIDDFRITRNVGRYNSNFIVPTTAFPEGATVVSGTVLDIAGLPCSRQVNIHSRANGRLIGTAMSDPTTGVFSIGSPELCYAVVLDSTGSYNALVLDRLNPL